MPDFITSVLQQEKRCIFCGEPPSDKNKEHVIPRWLIALTGDSKRTWHLGVKFNDPEKEHRRFSADQFQFPACETCNSKYSPIEGRTKTNMTKLLDNQSLSATEWDDLLDWFDKVRIGLFIGNMILNKDFPIPDPNFFIEQRIGAKDRCVLVYPLHADHVGLTMIGAGDPVFFYQPTSFMLIVNKLLFVNISSDFLLAGRMGFPFPRKIEWKGPLIGVNDCDAICRPKLPFIRFAFYPPIIGVYQTILGKKLLADESYAALTNSNYVRERMWLNSSTKTQPCVVKNKQAVFLNAADLIDATSLTQAQNRTFEEYCLRYFKYRHATLERALEIPGASKSMVRLLMEFNGYAVTQTKAYAYSV